MKEIYLDNSATTKVDKEVADLVYKTMLEDYGNPSSLHTKGLAAEQILAAAKKQLLEFLGAKDENIYFTSGGTESNNMAVFSGVKAAKNRGKHIVTTVAEHSSVLEAVKLLEKQGSYSVTYIAPQNDGRIAVEDVLAAVTEQTALVSIMYVNNETGAVFPVEEAASRLKKSGHAAVFHSDMVQAVGKLPFNFSKSALDIVTFSGHKIHAPKGIGALVCKKGIHLTPMFYGGGQQNNVRPGTESMPLIAGFGLAAQKAGANFAAEHAKIEAVSSYFKSEVLKLDNVFINSPENGYCGIVNVAFPGYKSEVMLHFLAGKGIFVSSGSACAKGAASHVLAAMKLPRKMLDSSLRISFCAQNTTEEVDTLIAALREGMQTIIKVG